MKETIKGWKDVVEKEDTWVLVERKSLKKLYRRVSEKVSSCFCCIQNSAVAQYLTDWRTGSEKQLKLKTSGEVYAKVEASKTRRRKEQWRKESRKKESWR